MTTNKPEHSFRESLKNIKPKDFAYVGVFFLFICIVGVMFFFSTRFISKNINKVFYTDDGVETEALNQAQYKLTAKKLGITVEAGAETVATSTVLTPTIASASSTISFDKSTLSLMIKNSTGKKGVASLLSKTFEDAGFNKAQTANEPDLYPTTTLYVKNSKKEYQALLLEVLQKSYPDAVATTTEPKSADAVIVIGGN